MVSHVTGGCGVPKLSLSQAEAVTRGQRVTTAEGLILLRKPHKNH